MTRCIRPAAFALVAVIGLLPAAACNDPVARIGGAGGEPPSPAELNARTRAWIETLESVASEFRTAYFEPDGSIESLTTGEFRVHYRDRWLWSSSIRERSSPGSLPSTDPDYLAIADGRVWQSFDPEDGWFAADDDNSVSDADWETIQGFYGRYVAEVDLIPDDAVVRTGDLDGRPVWVVEYSESRPGGTASGSRPDGDYVIDLRQDDEVRIHVDPASGAPLRRETVSRRWDPEEDRAQFRSNWSLRFDLISWNSDPEPPRISLILSEDAARRIALPNRHREPERRQPARAADDRHPADEGAFTLDQVRTALVRWVGALDTIRTRAVRREYGPGGGLERGGDEEIAINFRERWRYVVAALVGADGVAVDAERSHYVVGPERTWRAFDPDIGWLAETDYGSWTSLGEALSVAIGIDFDLIRAEYRASARLDDGRGYIAFFVPQEPSSRSARGGGDGPAREYRGDDTIHVYFDPETGAPESVDIYRLEWDVEDRSGARDTSVVTKYRVLEWNVEIERPATEPELSRSEYDRLSRQRAVR